MIASASVAAASGPETTTTSSGTRRGGAHSVGTTPSSFEHNLRDARSHHDRVPAREERRADGHDRADTPSVPADESATPRDSAAPPDGSTTASPSGSAPADASAVATAGASQPTAAAPAVAAAVGSGDVPVAATTAPATAVSSTTATPASSTVPGVPAGGAGAVELVQARGLTDGAGEIAPRSSVPSVTAVQTPAPSAARATGTAAPALATVGGSTAAESPATGAASARPHAGAPVTTATPAPAGGLSLTVAAGGAAPVATDATTATSRPTSPGPEGTAPQLVAAPTTSGSTGTVAAVSPQASTAPVAPVPAWVQQAVQTQLSGRLLAAARGGEPGAVQRLTLHLHPADLGSVQVVATLDDGTVSLQLAAANPTTRDALRASLATLRSDLAAAGLDGARLDVSDQPPSSHHGTTHQQDMGNGGSSRHLGGPDAPAAQGTPAERRTDVTAARPHPTGTHTAQGVDLHL